MDGVFKFVMGVGFDQCVVDALWWFVDIEASSILQETMVVQTKSLHLIQVSTKYLPIVSPWHLYKL